MAALRLVATLALVTACYRQDPDLYTTMPEPVVVEGPPGGEMDPAWQVGYVDENAAGSPTGSLEPSSDPQDPGYLTGTCTDAEIDATLDGYGEWIEVDGYGRVWRPYTTVVGVNFTPYETCGSWVWTDWGWTYACEWDWGWLPFHYGRWGWFDDYWGWVPGYEWSPAWVEWRGGGGYVGWRPLAPVLRDHRSKHDGIVLRDHRHEGSRVRDHRHRTAKTKDWQWRFVAASELGKPRIRAHLAKSLAEGLRVTSRVSRPRVRPNVQPVRAASIMRGRLAVAAQLRGHRSHATPARRVHRPAHGAALDARALAGARGPRGVAPGRVTDAHRPRRSVDASPSVYQPIYRPPTRQPISGNRAHAAPSRNIPSQTLGGLPVTPTTPDPTPPPSGTLSPGQRPTTTYQPPAAQPPRAPTHTPATSTPPRAPTTYRPPGRYSPPSRPSTYRPPSRPSTYRPPSRPSNYQPPSRPSTYQPPSRPSTYQPPSRPSYSPPARTYSPPARTYSPPPRTYSPPARTYSPPARSYSPSRSSSYRAPASSHSSSRSYSSSHSHSRSSARSRGFSGARSHRR